jgi:integrase
VPRGMHIFTRTTYPFQLAFFAPAQRLLAQLPSHLAEMAAFSLSTGLRKSNVTGLQCSQVDLSRCMAWVHPDQSRTRKAIAVPLNEDAVRILTLQVGNILRMYLRSEAMLL